MFSIKCGHDCDRSQAKECITWGVLSSCEGKPFQEATYRNSSHRTIQPIAASQPVIPVPQAIRTILTVTAAMMTSCPTLLTETIPVAVAKDDRNDVDATGDGRSVFPSLLIGRIAGETIKANDKGYPPHNTGTIEGYAIDPSDVYRYLNDEDQRASKLISFTVVDGHSTDISTRWNAIPISNGSNIDHLGRFSLIIPAKEVDESFLKIQYIRIKRSILEKLKNSDHLHRRIKGSEIGPHATIISKGQVIDTTNVGLLTQLGVKEVEVNCLPKVAILSSSNCARSNSKNKDNPKGNGEALCSILSSYGSCEPVHLQFDERVDPGIFTSDIASQKDLIILSESDVEKMDLLRNLRYTIIFGGLRMNPSKSTMFLSAAVSQQRKTLIFVLPKESKSATISLELCVRPCLDMMHKCLMGTGDVHSMIQNAAVHAEVEAASFNSVKLDFVYPTYHRVSLQYKVDGKDGIEFKASSSCVSGTNGLMILPKGIKGIHERTEIGDKYTVLLGSLIGTTAGDSTHLANAMMTIGILEVRGSGVSENGNHQKSPTDKAKSHTLEEIKGQQRSLSRRIMGALGPDEGLVVQAKRSKDTKKLRSKFRQLGPFLDVIIVVQTSTTFLENLDISAQLREMCSKEMKSMANALLHGAASQHNSLAALSESVAGYAQVDNKACLIISVPNVGLEGAISNVRNILKQSLSKARRQEAPSNFLD